MKQLLKNLVAEDSGQDLIEYALVAALVGLGAVAALAVALGPNTPQSCSRACLGLAAGTCGQLSSAQCARISRPLKDAFLSLDQKQASTGYSISVLQRG